MTVFVYLLHFDRPYPAGRRPQHYLGVARDMELRMREHHKGSSKSRLTRACLLRGIPVALARIWRKRYPKAAFDFERKLKSRHKNYSGICPLCRKAAP